MPSLIGRVRRVRNGVSKRIARRVSPFLIKPEVDVETMRLGSGDGSWVVPANLVDRDWVCYCVGVGVNATFDLELAERCGARVYSFDPTPRAIAYMQTLDYDRDRLSFLPYGVWSEETELRFYAPADLRHSNWSVVDLHGTNDYFTARCKRLSTLMRELGHDRLDLLKLDIEGSWSAVLGNILTENVIPKVLCVEFDSPMSVLKLIRIVRRLRRHGLRVAHFHNEDFLFVDESVGEERTRAT